MLIGWNTSKTLAAAATQEQQGAPSKKLKKIEKVSPFRRIVLEIDNTRTHTHIHVRRVSH